MRGDIAVDVFTLPALRDINAVKHCGELFQLGDNVLVDVRSKHKNIRVREIFYGHLVAHARDITAHLLGIFFVNIIRFVELKNAVLNVRVACHIQLFLHRFNRLGTRLVKCIRRGFGDRQTVVPFLVVFDKNRQNAVNNLVLGTRNEGRALEVDVKDDFVGVEHLSVAVNNLPASRVDFLICLIGAFGHFEVFFAVNELRLKQTNPAHKSRRDNQHDQRHCS